MEGRARGHGGASGDGNRAAAHEMSAAWLYAYTARGGRFTLGAAVNRFHSESTAGWAILSLLGFESP